MIGKFSAGKSRPLDLSNHYVVRRDGVTPPSSAADSPLWIISRACCACRFVDLAQVPSAKRDNALKLAALGWRPFSEAAFHVVMQQRFAILYAWDRMRLRQLHLESGVQPELQVVVPEPALQQVDVPGDSQENDAARRHISHPVLEGVVSKVYLGAELIAEQWWPALPDRDGPGWVNFSRTVGIASESADIQLVPSWLGNPMGHDPLRTQAIIPPRERLVLAVVAGVMTIATVWYANGWRLSASALSEAETSLAKTERELNSSLAARNAALSSQARAESIARLLDRPHALGVLALSSELLTQVTGPSPLQVEEWDLRGTQLRIVISSTALPAATTLVKAFEKAKTFQDVEATMDGSRLTLIAKVNASQISAGLPPSAAISGTSARESNLPPQKP